MLAVLLYRNVSVFFFVVKSDASLRHCISFVGWQLALPVVPKFPVDGRFKGSLPGTPAMAAKLTGHPWTLEELLEMA
jgi:hypothetical protein